MVQRIKNRNIQAASHLILLARIVDLSEGDILELGTGYFSTGWLDALTAIKERKIVSMESSPRWFERARSRYQSDYHDIIKIDNWADADIYGKHWGMVFIDHGPNAQRKEEIRKLNAANNFDYMVIHDTEPESDRCYGYSEIWPLFKNIYHYDRINPWTSVVSNRRSLSGI
jgi:hypothetical protein